jgi:hypothetical protein
MSEVLTVWDRARELLKQDYSNFPVDALGALSGYIEASERFFANPSEELLSACDEAMTALESFCAGDTNVRDAHTKVEGILNSRVSTTT